MNVGNARYMKREDLPETVPVFPLTGALLLPGGQLPLNIFEPRYLALFDAAISGSRLIGIVQPSLVETEQSAESPRPALSNVGCLGRITSFAETGDGRYITSISGICRFRMLDEIGEGHPYRTFRIAPMMTDLSSDDGEGTVNRSELLRVFKAYLDANKLEADWESV